MCFANSKPQKPQVVEVPTVPETPPAPPPAPPVRIPEIDDETDADKDAQGKRIKRRGRQSLRIDLAGPSTGGGTSGLSIPR